MNRVRIIKIRAMCPRMLETMYIMCSRMLILASNRGLCTRYQRDTIDMLAFDVKSLTQPPCIALHPVYPYASVGRRLAGHRVGAGYNDAMTVGAARCIYKFNKIA